MSVASETTCGVVAGTVAAAIVYPLDTLNTRLRAGMFSSVQDCVKGTLRKEGVRGFYKGFLAPLISQPLYMGAAFGGLALGRAIYDDYVRPSHHGDATFQRLLFSGAVSGVCCSTVVTPFERLRVLLQTSTSESGERLRAIRAVLRRDGPRTMYRGLGACMAREVPGCVIWFGTYEASLAYLLVQGVGKTSAVAAAGVFAALTFWTASMPTERVRVLQQSALSSKAGALSVAAQVMRTQGVAGFFIGLRGILARGALMDFFQFSGAEQVRQCFSSRHQP